MTEWKIEVYNSERYFTVTDNTVNDVPLRDCQAELTELHAAIRAQQSNTAKQQKIEQKPQTIDDNTLYQMASAAANGDKFLRLWRGEWVGDYKSQSEADFALINILAFYTDNLEQVERMFHYSALGQRAKAHRKHRFNANGQRLDFVGKMVERSFDCKLPTVNLSVLEQNLKHRAENPPIDPESPTIDVPALEDDWTVPPGLVGQIANYIYHTSPRPVKEVALAAAIAYFAGLFGRAYNISGAGLNQYVIIIAKTGIGKEGAANGISKLNSEITKLYADAAHYIGPSVIASPQGLIKRLSKHPCFVSQIDEFGLWLQRVTDRNANANDRGLRGALLSLYGKSNAGNVFHGSAYADQAKDIDAIANPTFSLIGDTTPDEFYRALDESNVSDGFVPRFTLIEYKGKRPPPNPLHNRIGVPAQLINDIIGALQLAKMHEQAHKFIDVKMSDEAKKFCDDFNGECDITINANEEEYIRMLWNRAHLRVLKLAGLLAVGVKPQEPIVTIYEARWAHNLVLRGINTLLARFKSGDIGQNAGQKSQIETIINCLRKYQNTTWTPEFGAKRHVSQEYHAKRIVPYSYIHHAVIQMAAFRKTTNPTLTLKQVLDDLCNQGVLNRYSGSVVGEGLTFYIRDLT